jgi:hypothetical protein
MSWCIGISWKCLGSEKRLKLDAKLSKECKMPFETNDKAGVEVKGGGLKGTL